MHVELLTHTENPVAIVAAAARLCYSDIEPQRLFSNLTEEESEKLVRKLIQSGHLSPLEHASFSFAISGISRACSHQLVRHRIASFSQRSQRYTTLSKDEFVVPDTLRKRGWAEIYKNLIELAHETYRAMVIEGVPVEDARYLLPNGAETALVMTMNARELRHFFSVRLCRRAQWEIRQIALRMWRVLNKNWPILFEKCGPSCITSTCKEETPCGEPLSPDVLRRE